MNRILLADTAQKIVANNKGILAADESTPTIKKRFDSIQTECTEINRNKYREMLFTSSNIEDYISGIILYDETIRQSTTCSDKIPFTKLLSDKDILPGIKVDIGAKALAGFENETITEGLDGLRERLNEYYNLGARFAKWRAVIKIGDDIPSAACIYLNAHALARYAALCQEANIVPIIEPEVLMDGTHDIDTCFDITEETLKTVFQELFDQNIFLEGIILKPNMIISALNCPEQAKISRVAEETVNCFLRTVPAAVPGICFLSGGQSDLLATQHLNAMNHFHSNLPWKLSFSYGRALQSSALKAWAGKDKNFVAGQNAFLKRAKLNSAAAAGSYLSSMEG